jgi:hypothetical protein
MLSYIRSWFGAKPKPVSNVTPFCLSRRRCATCAGFVAKEMLPVAGVWWGECEPTGQQTSENGKCSGWEARS